MMTSQHKKQVDEALRLYQARGEFDGRSVAQARACLIRARHTWDRDLASYVKKKLGKKKRSAMTMRKADQRITAAHLTTYPDTGQTKVWIEWSDGSSTSGSPSSVHMQELVKRATREGVRVKYGLFGKER